MLKKENKIITERLKVKYEYCYARWMQMKTKQVSRLDMWQKLARRKRNSDGAFNNKEG